MNKLIARSYVVCPAGIGLKGTFGVGYCTHKCFYILIKKLSCGSTFRTELKSQVWLILYSQVSNDLYTQIPKYTTYLQREIINYTYRSLKGS